MQRDIMTKGHNSVSKYFEKKNQPPS